MKPASGKQCELKVAKKEKRGLVVSTVRFYKYLIQLTCCQCRQVERTRMADKADVGISDRTQIQSLC